MSSVPIPTPTPTPEELELLRKKIRSLEYGDGLDASLHTAAHGGWEAGYLARQVREKEIYTSAYGARTIAVLKALLAIVRPPTTVELAAVKAATDLLDELEGRGVAGSSLPANEARGANGPGEPGARTMSTPECRTTHGCMNPGHDGAPDTTPRPPDDRCWRLCGVAQSTRDDGSLTGGLTFFWQLDEPA